MKAIHYIYLMVLFNITAVSTYKAVCIGKQHVLDCPLQQPMVWKLKQQGGSLRTLSLNHPPRLLPRTTQQFDDNVRITKHFSLVFSSFKTEYNGLYICINKSKRVSYNVVSTQCEVETCPGDEAVVECGILRYQRFVFTQMSWKDNRTTVIVADKNLRPTYVNTKYKGVHLSPSGALVIPMNKTLHLKRFTCVLYDDTGITPRRSTVTLKSMQCTNNVTVEKNGRVDLNCPYYKMLSSHPRATKLVWTKESRKIVTITVHGHAIDLNVSSNVSGVDVDGKIIIKSISERDKGTFTCSVLQRDGFVLAKHSVTIDVTQVREPREMAIAKSSSWINTPRFPFFLFCALCIMGDRGLWL